MEFTSREFIAAIVFLFLVIAFVWSVVWLFTPSSEGKKYGVTGSIYCATIDKIGWGDVYYLYRMRKEEKPRLRSLSSLTAAERTSVYQLQPHGSYSPLSVKKLLDMKVDIFGLIASGQAIEW